MSDRPGMPRFSHRRVFLVVSAVAATTLILVAHPILLPFVLALVVAYVLTPAVLRVERLRVPRWAAILIVYAITLGTVGGFIGLIVPRLVAEGRALGTEWPRHTERARDEWLPQLDEKLSRWTGQKVAAPPSPSASPDVERKPAPLHIDKLPDGSYEVRIDEGVRFREAREGIWQIEQSEQGKGLSSATMLREALDKAVVYVRENSLQVLKIGQQIAGAITRGIFNLFMTLMLAAYLMLTHEKIIHFFRELWAPPDRDSFDRFLHRLDRGLAGVVRGQLLICLVNGVLSAIGFWMFDLKYWPILSIIAAVMSLIPIFGSILSSIPAVAVGLTESPATAFGVLAWIVGIHQLEANFLNPKIIGDAAKIHPVLVVFSLLVGEHFFQIKGALFAVPCMSIAQTIFLHFRESTLGLADPLATIPPPAQMPLDIPSIPPVPLRRIPAELTPQSGKAVESRRSKVENPE
jgi:predicted PurR-regulated permease PerM